jgi:hypothetical protein
MRTLKQTTDVQKDLMKEMNIDNVDDMIDQMQEIKYAQEEFSDAIQKNYEVEVDEADLDEELEQLDYDMRVQLDAKELTVPSKKVLTKKEVDEKDLEDFVVNK